MPDPFNVAGNSNSHAGDPFGVGKSSGAAPSKSGGGFLGSLEHAAHWTAGKIGLAAHDLKTIPGGIGQMVKTEAGAIKSTVEHPWVTGAQKQALLREYTHPLAPPAANDPQAAALNLVRGQVANVKTSFEHPARDPFQTLLNASLLLHGGASTIGRGAEVARTGKLAAAVRPLPVAPRLLRVGDAQAALHPSRTVLGRAAQALHDKIVQNAITNKPEGKIGSYGTRRVGAAQDETARYQQRMREAPANALDQAGKRLTAKTQPGLGRVRQAALELTSTNTHPEAAAAYHLAQAAKGVESARNQAVAKLYQTVADQGLLTRNAAGDVIVNAADHPKLAQADLALARVQGRGDEILARYGIRSPEQLQQRVSGPGRIRAGATYEPPTPGKAGVSPALEAATAARDRVAALHARALDQEAAYHATLPRDLRGPMTDQQAAARLAELDKQHAALVKVIVPEVSQYGGKASQLEQLNRNFRAGKTGIKPTTVGQEEAQAADARLRKVIAANPDHPVAQQAAQLLAERDALRSQLNARGEASLEGTRPADLPRGGEQPNVPAASNPYRNRIVQLGTQLEAAQARVDRLATAAAGRVKPTGIVGGLGSRPGRGFVSYATQEPKAPTSPAAASPGPVVGETKPPITNQTFTGGGISKGFIPKDVTGQAARHYRSILRFVNTTERRNAAIATGNEVRQSTRDVLVRVPGEEHAQIPQIVEEALGRSKPTVDDVAGINAALDAYKQDLVPGLRDRFSMDSRHPVGTSAADAAAHQGLEAPGGYRWVDKNVLGNLAKPPATPRGRTARVADRINSAVTAATVYFKIGHLGTRGFTNTSTNILQGSALPHEIARSVDLWQNLSHEERQQALAASGQHGYLAMPHEGTGATARIAGSGAKWWAKHIDAPFRFNSIAYEARKAGFDTPAKFRFLLAKLEDPSGLNPADAARIDAVAKEANRAGIAYDRLNPAERRFVTRGIWFYPWVKGATMFAGHTFLEHPYKSAIIGNAAAQGRQTQQAELGTLPSYAQGLFQVAPPDATGRPLVADFSTFSPFATPANVLEAIQRPRNLAGFANPVTGAAAHLAFGLDQFGNRTNKPYTSALSELVSPAPEAQILNAYLERHKDQSGRMYRTTPRSALERALAGPGLPRRLNVAAAHKSYGREASGR